MYDTWNQILSYTGPSSNFCEITRTRGFIDLRNCFHNHIKDFSKKEKKSKPKLKVFFIIRNQTRLDKTKKKCHTFLCFLCYSYFVLWLSLVNYDTPIKPLP